MTRTDSGRGAVSGLTFPEAGPTRPARVPTLIHVVGSKGMSTLAMRPDPARRSARGAVLATSAVLKRGLEAQVTAGESASERWTDPAEQPTGDEFLTMAARAERRSLTGTKRSRPLLLAGLAVAPALVAPTRRFGRPAMTSDASLGLEEPLCWGFRQRRVGVVPRCDKAQVLWVDAAPVATHVVDHQPRRQGSDELAIGPTMSSLLVADVEAPIACGIDEARPQPARLGLLDLRQEPRQRVHVGGLYHV